MADDTYDRVLAFMTFVAPAAKEDFRRVLAGANLLCAHSDEMADHIMSCVDLAVARKLMEPMGSRDRGMLRRIARSYFGYALLGAGPCGVSRYCDMSKEQYAVALSLGLLLGPNLNESTKGL